MSASFMWTFYHVAMIGWARDFLKSDLWWGGVRAPKLAALLLSVTGTGFFCHEGMLLAAKGRGINPRSFTVRVFCRESA